MFGSLSIVCLTFMSKVRASPINPKNISPMHEN
jgi:hypothetical protein